MALYHRVIPYEIPIIHSIIHNIHIYSINWSILHIIPVLLISGNEWQIEEMSDKLNTVKKEFNPINLLL